MGALAAGHDVVAVEQDEVQFGHLLVRFNSLAEKYKANASAFLGTLGIPTPAPTPAASSKPAKMASPKPETPVPALKAEDDAGPSALKAEDDAGPSAPPISGPVCLYCALSVLFGPLVTCVGCEKQVHKECLPEGQDVYKCHEHEAH